ncbi:MAG: TonB-dependent receptor [Steroidobacteraceae bacterium]|nr:TonB-dependent receptor [Steroidobacteraceae bacterium]
MARLSKIRFVLAAAGFWLDGTVVAQDDGPQQFEEVVVTGSRIPRPDFESASPIVSLTGDALLRTGSTSIESSLGRLPQFVPSFTSTSNNPGNGGQSNVQLRGLGLTSTLVLVDGRRLVPANGTGVVDLNVIPGSMVESVEIVTGGASAVYGSDAIAGVVNFRLKDRFEGIEFQSGYGVTERSDGIEYYGGVTGGFAFASGRGQLLGHVEYAERDSVDQSQRRYSQYSLGYVGPGAGTAGPGHGFVPFGSSNIEEGLALELFADPAAFDTLFQQYGYAPGDVPYQEFLGFNQDGTLFTAGNFSPDSVANFRGEVDPKFFNDAFYSYNFAPYNHLQLPLERVSVFVRGSFELNEAIELYGDALAADYSSGIQLAPTPSEVFFVPPTNPYVSEDLRTLLDTREEPEAPLALLRRFSELTSRRSEVQYDVRQFTLGLRGEAFGDWRFDAYAQAGANDQEDKQTGNALLSRVEELTFAPDGGVSICGGFNPFGAGSISAGCAAYIAVDGVNRSGFDQSIVEASLTGPVLALPAGEARVVLGAMHKRDAFFYRADPAASVFLEDGRSDLMGFNASADIDGDDHNTDLYVELLVPLVDDVPGVRSLEAVIGYRYSDYASIGGADAYKAELLYQPVEPVRLRSSFQHAVRAPSVFELYQPQLPWRYLSSPFDLLDPCTAGSPERSGADAARVEELCVAQGVPPDALADFSDPDNLFSGVNGGNPELQPEQADTLTLGFVLQSWSLRPALSGMRVSLDWYRIKVEEAILPIDAYFYLPACYDPTFNPDFSTQQEFCSYFSRDPGTGEIASFFDINRNIAALEASGVDLQFDWSLPLGPGSASVNWLLSWMDYLDETLVPAVPPDERVGTIGGFAGSAPEWKWNLTLDDARLRVAAGGPHARMASHRLDARHG